MDRQDKLAIVGAGVIIFTGLLIGGRPLSDHIYTGLNGPNVDVIENPETLNVILF